MPRLPIVATAFLLTILLLACAEPADVGEPADGDPTEALPVEPDDGDDADGGGDADGAEPGAAAGEITGTFGGSAELEGGCAWVETEDGTRYEVQYPEGYEVRFDPLQLAGPGDEVIAEEGDEVTVRGSEEPDMMSFCQVGPIFSATEVEA